VRGRDQGGRERRRAIYVEPWNGNGSFRFDCVGRGAVEIVAPWASIIGAIPTCPLDSYMLSVIGGGLGDDGLL
jgi:hypothetical protein